MPLSVTQTVDRQAGRKTEDGKTERRTAELTDEQTNGRINGRTTDKRSDRKAQTDGNCMVKLPDEIC